jgi:hypothetical protein
MGRLKARPVPEWNGLWHAFTGDLRTWDHDLMVRGHVRCGLHFGVDLRARDGEVTAAIAPELPGVDVCRRCLPMR